MPKQGEDLLEKKNETPYQTDDKMDVDAQCLKEIMAKKAAPSSFYTQLQRVSNGSPQTIRFRLGDNKDAVLLRQKERLYNAQTLPVNYEGMHTNYDSMVKDLARKWDTFLSQTSFNNMPLVVKGTYAIAYSDNPAEQQVKTILNSELFFQGFYPNPLDTPKVYLGAIVAFLNKDEDGVEKVINYKWWWFNRGQDPSYTHEQKKEFPIDINDTFWRFGQDNKNGNNQKNKEKGVTETSILTIPVYLVPQSDLSAEALLPNPKENKAKPIIAPQKINEEKANPQIINEEKTKPQRNPDEDKGFEKLFATFAPLLKTNLDALFDQMIQDPTKSQKYLFTLLKQLGTVKPEPTRGAAQAARYATRRGAPAPTAAVAAQNPAEVKHRRPTKLSDKIFALLTLFFELDKPDANTPHPFQDDWSKVYSTDEAILLYLDLPAAAGMKSKGNNASTLDHDAMQIFRRNLVASTTVSPLPGRKYAIATDQIRKLTIRTNYFEPRCDSFEEELQNTSRQVNDLANRYHANNPALFATLEQKEALKENPDIGIVDLKQLLEKALKVPKDNDTWIALKKFVAAEKLPPAMPNDPEEWESLIRKIPHKKLPAFTEEAWTSLRLPKFENKGLKSKTDHILVQTYRERYQAHMDALFCFLYTVTELIHNFCVSNNINNLTPLEYVKLLKRLTFENPDFRAFKNEYNRTTRVLSELLDEFFIEFRKKQVREGRNPAWVHGDQVRKALESWGLVFKLVKRSRFDEMQNVFFGESNCFFSHRKFNSFQTIQDLDILFETMKAKNSVTICCANGSTVRGVRMGGVIYPHIIGGGIPTINPASKSAIGTVSDEVVYDVNGKLLGRIDPERSGIKSFTLAELLGPFLDPAQELQKVKEVKQEPNPPLAQPAPVPAIQKSLSAPAVSAFFPSETDLPPTFAEIQKYLEQALRLAKVSSQFLKQECQKLQPAEKSMKTLRDSAERLSAAAPVLRISFQVDPVVTKKTFLNSESFKILVWLASKFGHDQILVCKIEQATVTVDLSPKCIADLKTQLSAPSVLKM